MDNNHKLGLYVSYYLSRFNNKAYKNLGFGNQLESHKKIGELLSIKPNTIQNWRDEFDPLFGHRVGWNKRPMNPSRIKVAQALENLDEEQIYGIVNDILNGRINEEPYEKEQLISVISCATKGNFPHKFILRAPTGKAAEEVFQRFYIENKIPIEGILIDCRDLGVGYDFLIEKGPNKYYVEVKGISDSTGGILLTDKEWNVAQREGDSYYLAIISNIKVKPIIKFIQNPAIKLNPKKNIYTSIQISWSLSQNQIDDHYD